MKRAKRKLENVIPFSIVDDIHESVDFYHSKPGFDIDLLIPEDNPFSQS